MRNRTSLKKEQAASRSIRQRGLGYEFRGQIVVKEASIHGAGILTRILHSDITDHPNKVENGLCTLLPLPATDDVAVLPMSHFRCGRSAVNATFRVPGWRNW